MPARPSSATRACSARSSADGSGNAHGCFAACSASAMIASITGWNARWPNSTAPSITSSDSSDASLSTISTPSDVPASTRSSWLSLISASVGLSTYSPLA